MRLDRYLANNTDLSRKEVKRLIKARLISVDGAIVINPALKIDENDHIEADGRSVQPTGSGYFMLNKPEGVVCANKDSVHPTVFDLLDEPHKDLHVAGRLDIDTTGLVLITNDGQWSHRATSPKYKCMKTYQVTTEELITKSMISKLESGIFLEPEKIRTQPAQVELITKDEILLHIYEGKYHQVKRMLHAVHNAVESLQRISIGNIALDKDLAPGEYRPLSPEEINCV